MNDWRNSPYAGPGAAGIFILCLIGVVLYIISALQLHQIH
jgi:hypothetical protein